MSYSTRAKGSAGPRATVPKLGQPPSAAVASSAVRVRPVDLNFVLLLAVLSFGVLVYAAVKRRAVFAAVAGVAFLLFAVVWAGETFGFLNV